MKREMLYEKIKSFFLKKDKSWKIEEQTEEINQKTNKKESLKIYIDKEIK